MVAPAIYVLPRLRVSEGLADAIAFAGGALFPILGLSLAAMVEVSLAFALGIAAIAAVTASAIKSLFMLISSISLTSGNSI